MDYDAAVEFLDGLIDYEKLGLGRQFGGRVNLDSMRALAGEMGNPHEGLRCVHIAGTKGKGSVAAFVESIVRAAGYKTGLFTSPHLVSPRERIRVNGRPISTEVLTECVEAVVDPVKKIRAEGKLTPSTFFEVYTVMAFMHFARTEVDLAVIETGLGGRLDATNIIAPLACAITTLGLDHTRILGDTIEQIAAEKAGIIKPDVPVVLAPNAPEAELVVEDHAEKVGAPLVRPPEVIEVQPPPRQAVPDEGETFTPPTQKVILRRDGEQIAYDIALLGPHQAVNFAVAVGLADVLAGKGYDIGESVIAQGGLEVRWPGRVQILQARPWLVADCAHNEQSARALAGALPGLVEYDRIFTIMGISEDKDASAVAQALSPMTDTAIFTQADIPRAMPVESLYAETKEYWDDCRRTQTVGEAIALAQDLARPEDCILVTGSFFVVGEFLEIVFHQTP